MPETVYGIALAYTKNHETMPLLSVKIYVYQLCRALAYLHALGICHRDIKPQNLLVDPSQHILKLCDFGSAKQLVAGEPNVSYICSRYYRAPELIFGATDYSTQIDTWSLGCVAAELLIGRPLFPGRDCVEQLVEIFQILGTPTREEIEAMNPSYTDFRFTHVARRNWNIQCNYTRSPELIELISRTLAYSPVVRIKPIEACIHPAFDELRMKGLSLPDGKPLPKSLFEFTDIELGVNPELVPRLLAHG
jgi:glycogen synthase kinase 3 beta